MSHTLNPGAPGRNRKKSQKDNVIHVQFGTSASLPEAESVELSAPSSADETREPVTDLFTRREVARLLNVDENRLRALDRAGVVSPSGSPIGKQRQRTYTFQDLIALRATDKLIASKVTLRDVSRAVRALRESLPRVTQPLRELRIMSDGSRIIVRGAEGTFEAATGQMVIDFQISELREDVVRVLRPAVSPARRETAYELYVRASALDEDPLTFDEAEALYKRAIALDPSLAIAHTNLGNIMFRRGDEMTAEACYRRAIALDGAQPEAHYNLGYLTLGRDQPKDSILFFERALKADPQFADAHFNLAIAYEQSGQLDQARTHWLRYLEIEPAGTWSTIARDRIADP